jgi:hypothetical protein
MRDEADMNEFSCKSKKELEHIKLNMWSYKEGALDTFKIISDLIQENSLKTQKFWSEKIELCQEEINKRKE